MRRSICRQRCRAGGWRATSTWTRCTPAWRPMCTPPRPHASLAPCGRPPLPSRTPTPATLHACRRYARPHRRRCTHAAVTRAHTGVAARMPPLRAPTPATLHACRRYARPHRRLCTHATTNRKLYQSIGGSSSITAWYGFAKAATSMSLATRLPDALRCMHACRTRTNEGTQTHGSGRLSRCDTAPQPLSRSTATHSPTEARRCHLCFACMHAWGPSRQ